MIRVLLVGMGTEAPVILINSTNQSVSSVETHWASAAVRYLADMSMTKNVFANGSTRDLDEDTSVPCALKFSRELMYIKTCIFIQTDMNWFLVFIVAAIIVITISAIVLIWKADSPQVYLYYNAVANPTTLAEAQNIAAAPALGGQIATPAQVQAAQQAGAQWCSAGWASDGNVYFPMQKTIAGCGSPGINKSSCSRYDNNCGVIVYGKKPSSKTTNVVPFSGSQWSQWKWYDPMHS